MNDAECPNSNWNCTQSEYLNVSAFGNDQLRQRIALALSELWVAPQHTDNAMPFYLNTLANDAFTNYRTIMNDGALSPAMGDYLNMVNSGKPSSPATAAAVMLTSVIQVKILLHAPLTYSPMMSLRAETRISR